MGTNYYAVRNRPTTDHPIHIGKNSYGWLFLFQAHNEPYNEPPVVWNTYDQVKEWLERHVVREQDYVIMNEYDEVVPYMDFILLVDSAQDDPKAQKNPDNFAHDTRNVNGYRFTDGDFW